MAQAHESRPEAVVPDDAADRMTEPAGAGDERDRERADAAVTTLVQACLAGDETAWVELVERYGRLVYSVPSRLGLAAADADDVFQNVFVLLYRNLGQLRDQRRVVSWLITTAHRESWRVAKRASQSAPLDHELASDAAPPEAAVMRLEREQTVREAMRRLDARCRELLTALFLAPAPAPYDALARQLGMPVGSIGPTRARCFKKLQGALRDLGFDEPHRD